MEPVLTILDEEPRVGAQVVSSSSSKMDVKTLLLQFCVAVIAAAIVVFVIAPSQSDFDKMSLDMKTQLDTSVATITAKTGEMSTSIDQKFATLQNSINQQITGISGQVATVDGRVDAFDARIVNLDGLPGKVDTAVAAIDGKVSSSVSSSLTDFETRLAALESRGSGNGSSSYGNVSIEAKTWGDVALSKPTVPVLQTLDTLVKVTLANGETVGVEDIVLILTVASNGAEAPDVVSISGIPVMWNILTKTNGAIVAMSTPPPSLKLDAGEVKKYYVNVQLTYNTGVSKNTYYEIDMTVDDYDLE